MSQPSLIGTWVALLLTLFILSSLWRDQLLSRLAEHLLVGTAAGYAGVVAIRQVIIPRLVEPLWRDPTGNWHLLVPLTLASLWLASMGSSSLWARRLGALGLALLFGVGAGLVVGGAWRGTLWPQVWAASQVQPVLSSILLLLGTLSVPLYFHVRASSGRSSPSPSVHRERNLAHRLLLTAASLGQATLLIALGVIFARAAVARLVLLVDRLQFVGTSLEVTGIIGWADGLWNLLKGLL